jgi:2-dehydropantoate 2-reductase
LEHRVNVWILGAGAMGSLWAYLLHRAGVDVSLIEKDAGIVKAVSSSGLRVEGVSGPETVPARIDFRPPKTTPDLVLVMVKSHDTHAAVASIKDGLGPRTTVVSLQTGIGNDEVLAAVLGAERVVAGATGLTATLLAPGQVLHTGWGDTAVAAKDSLAKEKAEAVAAFLTRHGIKTTVADDLPSLLWGRTLLQVAYGALTALTRIRNGRVLEIEPAKTLMRHALEEAVGVLQAAQIPVPYLHPAAQVEQLLSRTADNLSAMVQDLYRGKRSEIEVINGAVVKLAESLGLDAPINRTLTLLVQTIERTT